MRIDVGVMVSDNVFVFFNFGFGPFQPTELVLENRHEK